MTGEKGTKEGGGQGGEGSTAKGARYVLSRASFFLGFSVFRVLGEGQGEKGNRGREGEKPRKMPAGCSEKKDDLLETTGSFPVKEGTSRGEPSQGRYRRKPRGMKGDN